MLLLYLHPEAAALSCPLMLLLYPHPEAAAMRCQTMLLLNPHPEAAAMRCQTTRLLNPRQEAAVKYPTLQLPEAAEPLLHLRPAAVEARNHPLLKLQEK
jgi:hypothetical protein